MLEPHWSNKPQARNSIWLYKIVCLEPPGRVYLYIFSGNHHVLVVTLQQHTEISTFNLGPAALETQVARWWFQYTEIIYCMSRCSFLLQGHIINCFSFNLFSGLSTVCPRSTCYQFYIISYAYKIANYFNWSLYLVSIRNESRLLGRIEYLLKTTTI